MATWETLNDIHRRIAWRAVGQLLLVWRSPFAYVSLVAVSQKAMKDGTY